MQQNNVEVKKMIVWVDTYLYESTHLIGKIGYELTHSLMSRHILLYRPKTDGKKGVWVNTKHVWVDTCRVWVDTYHYVSTHTELIWKNRGMERLCVDAKEHVSTHNVQKCIFLSFSFVFTCFIYYLHGYSIWL